MKMASVATFGDVSILDLHKVGFLSSRKVPPAAVMRCYDWATEMRDKGVCVMGGFQSPLERDVLTFLLQEVGPANWRAVPDTSRQLCAIICAFA